MQQIRSRNYAVILKDALIGSEQFANTPLAVAISWDYKTKAHECLVEEL